VQLLGDVLEGAVGVEAHVGHDIGHDNLEHVIVVEGGNDLTVGGHQAVIAHSGAGAEADGDLHLHGVGGHDEGSLAAHILHGHLDGAAGAGGDGNDGIVGVVGGMG